MKHKGEIMKKRKLIWAFVFLVSIAFSGCATSSKGEWSEVAKNRFREDMNGIESLSDIGANKEKWIECYLSKCEMNYDTYFQANQDEAGCSILAEECVNEILSNGSVKGNWSQNDRSAFKADMDTISELDILGENKSKWIDCYLEKCEDYFPSYYHTDQDENGCERLAAECGSELFGLE